MLKIMPIIFFLRKYKLFKNWFFFFLFFFWLKLKFRQSMKNTTFSQQMALLSCYDDFFILYFYYIIFFILYFYYIILYFYYIIFLLYYIFHIIFLLYYIFHIIFLLYYIFHIIFLLYYIFHIILYFSYYFAQPWNEITFWRNRPPVPPFVFSEASIFLQIKKYFLKDKQMSTSEITLFDTSVEACILLE